jgi:predicted transcriptional regulator
LLSTKLAIDIVFVALIFVAVSITAIVLVKVLSDMSASSMGAVTQSEQQKSDNTAKLEVTDPDSNSDATSPGANGSVDFSRNVQEFTLTDKPLTTSIYESSPYILPITWGAVGGTLIWRGKVRSTWSKQGYDYDTFRLVAKMRGSPTRIRLLNAIHSPKNKLQLAKELDVDWKTIDNHIEMLVEGGLVEERGIVGTSRYYVITENGMKVLSLLSSSEMASKENDD